MIASNLKVLLAERGLTVSKVSEDTGISRTTLTALCSNKSKGIQFDTLDTLCNYLNILPDEFFLFTPYRIVFEYDTDNCVNIKFTNLTTHKTYLAAAMIEIDQSSVWLNFVEGGANDRLLQVIKDLPKYYLSKVNAELKQLLISKYYISEDLLDGFTFETNLS